MAIDEHPSTPTNGSTTLLELPDFPSLDAEELQDRCFELSRRGMPRRQFAAAMSEMITAASGARAVAVLVYNRRKHRLTLFADHGLSDEAREALAGGAQHTWDIPIRGLRNRRISVIEAADRNRFVPPGLVSVSPDDLSIACIPVYYQNLPSAVVLLFSSSERPLSDADLHAITLAVRVGARGLREGNAPVVAEAEEGDVDLEGDIEDGALPTTELEGPLDVEELSYLRRSLSAQQEQKDALAARLERAEEELGRARLEIERAAQTVRTLTSSRQGLAQDRDRLKADLEEIERAREAELAQLRGEISALEDRLLVAESDRLRHQRTADQLRSGREQSLLALERERDGLLERVRAAESGIAAVQGALGAVREDRDRLAANSEALARHVQTGAAALAEAQAEREQALADLGTDRDGWREQVATLQSEIARWTEEQRRVEHELRDTIAARDAAADQLRSAHDEIARFSRLHHDGLDRSQQAEAARAAAAAEGESLREALSAERAEHRRTEQTLRADIDAAHRGAERAASAMAEIQGRVAELERLLVERDAQVLKLQQERELVGQDAQTIQDTLAKLETEAQRQVESLTAERDALAHKAAQAEAALEAEAERTRAEAQSSAALKERVSQFQESVAQEESKRTALSGQLAQAQTELEALRQQSTDRGQLARQVTELSGKLIEHEKLLEASRDELRQTGAQLAQTERQRAALAKGLQAAHREKVRIEASVERDQDGVRETLDKFRAENLRLEKERIDALDEIQTQRSEHAAAVAEMQSTLEQLRAERERAVAERDRHASHLSAAQAEGDARTTQMLHDTQGLARRLAERERRIDELSDLLRQRDAALERAAEERRGQSQVEQKAETAALDLQGEVKSLREALDKASREHADAIEQIKKAHRQEIAQVQRLAEDRETKARQASLLALEERRAARYDAPLIIERSDDKGTVIESVPAAVEAAADELRLRLGEGEIVVFDRGALCDDAIAVLKGAGIEAGGSEPTDTAIDALDGREIASILLNVAPGPPAWQLVRKLRERPATKNVPILAYLMNPEAANGFCFGRCDFGLWPSDLTDLVDLLKKMRPTVRRILVASSDVEALGRVREPLAKARISASNVLDGKQARELGHSLQPEAAVLHFSPTCSDIARALGSYRQLEATRDLPLLLLLDQTGSARESIFFQAANRELLRNGRFDFSQLPNELVRLKTPK